MADYSTISLRWRLNDVIAYTLMRSFCVVVFDILTYEIPQMGLTQYQHPIEALIFDAPDEAFREWIQIRTRN